MPIPSPAPARGGTAIARLSSRLDEALSYLLERQQYSSAATSLNQVPRALSQLDREGVWGSVKSVLDLGAGKYDTGKQFLAKRGVTCHCFDPYNRTEKENCDALASGKHGVILMANVLNVIKERTEREALLKMAKRQLRQDGQLVIQVYSGTGDGNSRQTGKDQYQLNRPLDWYIPEVKKHFGSVEVKHGLLRASQPHQ